MSRDAADDDRDGVAPLGAMLRPDAAVDVEMSDVGGGGEGGSGGSGAALAGVASSPKLGDKRPHGAQTEPTPKRVWTKGELDAERERLARVLKEARDELKEAKAELKEATRDHGEAKRDGLDQDTVAALKRRMDAAEEAVTNQEAIVRDLNKAKAEVDMASPSGPVEMRKVPEAEIDAFLAGLDNIGVVLATTTSETVPLERLGLLYKPGTTWPVAKNKIDMRLLSREELLGRRLDESLRPVARKLANAMNASPAGGLAFGLVAVPASGKTSGIIDLGRVHYVVLLQASEQSNDGVQGMARRSRDYDSAFGNLVVDVRTRTTALKSHFDEDRKTKWLITEQRSLVELVARALELERLRRLFETEGKGVVQPWDFMQHQLCSGQDFVDKVVRRLHDWDVDSLKMLAEKLVDSLRKRGVLTSTRQLVVAIDETEYARSVDVGSFLHPAATRDLGDKGLLSPLASAAGLFRDATNAHVVFAGTGASKSKIESMQTDLGKAKGVLNITVFSQQHFPKATAEDVNAVTNRLNVSQSFPRVSDVGARIPVFRTKDERGRMPLSEFIETYVVNARFRILAGAVERVSTTRPGTLTADKLWEEALRVSVDSHVEGLVALFLRRLGPNSRAPVKPETLAYVQRLFVATSIAGGDAAGFPESATEGLRAAQENDLVDLTEIGIASESRSEDVSEVMTAHITEAFVLDALNEYLTREDVSRAFVDARIESSVALLHQVLREFGPAAQFKGNVLEYIAIQRLASWGTKGMLISELPFVKDAIKGREAEWAGYHFRARRVVEPRGARSTADLLVASDAASYVVWPEDQCRPDAVAIVAKDAAVSSVSAAAAGLLCVVPRPLRPTSPNAAEGADGAGGPEVSSPRAITLACAVYGGKVTNDKMLDQVHSTDMSRAFLSKDKGRVYDATRARRERWVNAGLHRVRTVRLCVALPSGNTPATDFADVKVSNVTGDEFVTCTGEDRDVVVTLDASNIHLLLGKPSDSTTNANLFKLLKVATGQSDGWGGGR